MILQRCKVIKTKTDDGRFEMPPASMGMEVWVIPQTISMVRIRRGQEEFKAMMIRAKDQNKPIPVEILEFFSEFKVEGYDANS